jgi:hypothetical protein
MGLLTHRVCRNGLRGVCLTNDLKERHFLKYAGMSFSMLKRPNGCAAMSVDGPPDLCH